MLVVTFEPTNNLRGKNVQTTKHNATCTMAFGRHSKHDNCPRCQELKNGSAPRSGWQKGYYAIKAQAEKDWSLRLKNHNCSTSGCGSICVAFDW